MPSIYILDQRCSQRRSYSDFQPQLDDDGFQLLQGLFPTSPPYTAQYFPPNFDTLPDPHGLPGLIFQPRELFPPSGSPAFKFSPSSSHSLTLDPQVESPTPAVEDLLDDTPEVSEVSHILIIYKLLLINVLMNLDSAMDFQNNDDLEERSLLMQIDENASQEGLESNSEENGSFKEKAVVMITVVKRLEER